MTSLITIAGVPAHHVEIEVPRVGCWTAHVHTSDLSTPIKGKVKIIVDNRQYVGTVVSSLTALHDRVIDVVAGAGGWRQTLPPKGYSNDLGVSVKALADDVARECGEQLGTFEPVLQRLSFHYARTEWLASDTLVDVIRGADWWVDFNGVTQVGKRPSTTGTVEIRAYDPVTETIVTDEPLVIGATVDALALPSSKTIHSLLISATIDSPLQCLAKCRDDELADLVLDLARAAADERLFGVYEYRVTSGGSRPDVEPASPGLPTLRRVNVRSGIPGVTYSVPTGATVYVQFVAGDRAKPIILAYDSTTTALTFGTSISVEGEVTAHANNLSERVTLTGHKHATPAGLSDKPMVPETP